jgi:hypothetical protein
MAAAALSRRLIAASDKVNIAVMGVRGQGKNLTGMFASLPDVNIPYLCDVDPNVFGPAAKIVEDKKGVKPQLIGDGLYGVDIKETEHGIFVVEVNDNPNIEHGIEDAVGKDEVWTRILRWFIDRLEVSRG